MAFSEILAASVVRNTYTEMYRVSHIGVVMAPFSPLLWLIFEIPGVTSGALVRPNFIPYLLSLQGA